jgi:hypothetical protein
VREGQHGLVRALEVGNTWDTGYIRSTLARIYAVVGENTKALDEIETLLKAPSYFGPGWFRVDPNFAALRGNPRYERLVSGP